MTVTININSVIIPVIFTVMSVLAVAITAFSERNQRGWFSGLGTAIVFLIGIAVTLVAWIVWLLMYFIK